MGLEVLFLHGPAAAGKHTIGSIVAKRLELPLFHNHLTVDLVKTLFDFGTPEFARMREAIWKLSFQAAAEAGRSFLFTFNPEITVRPELIPELQDLVEERGGKVHYVELLCSDDEVVRRIDNPSRAQFGKLTDPAIFREFKDQGGFDFPPLPSPILTVDTERTMPEESAAAIIRAFRRA
ncbi:MAG: ATP-binding protein [Deltaproteobacteria bacterium]|nr:ATP-binding protein [Deltaproteobacteria bacterium]